VVEIDPAPTRTAAPVAPPSRWLLAVEVVLVLALSLGHSAADAVLGFYVRRTERPGAGGPRHPAVLYASEAPGRPLVDLARQLLDLGFAIVPVALAAYLLYRSGDGVRRTWLGGRPRWTDLALAALLAAAVAAVGLPFYLYNHDTTGATVVPDTLPHVWWRLPVLVVGALHNGVLEECVLLGFVQVRLRQLGVAAAPAIVLVAVLRGSYHLYQGFGGGLANFVMGLVFGWLYHRWGRVTPLVVAHTLLDLGAFLGYALLAGRVAWVPT
jgi:membrane protease YdiL (CAAX protease family)